MTVYVVLKDIKKIEADAIIVGFYEDERPLKGLAGEIDWLLCGSLSKILLSSGRLKGAVGEVALFSSRGKIPAEKIFLVGLGPKRDITTNRLGAAARHAVSSAAGAGVRRAALEWLPASHIRAEEFVSALQAGFKEVHSAGGMEISLVAPNAEMYEKLSGIMRTVGAKRSGG